MLSGVENLRPNGEKKRPRPAWPKIVDEQGIEWKIQNSVDFKGLTRPSALKDLHERIEHYEKVEQAL